MVNAALLLAVLLPGRSLVYASGYPKDSTTSWCSSNAVLPFYEEDVYRCYPNPWGSGNILLYVRFPDTSGIRGCMYGYHHKFIHAYQTGEWFEIGGTAPFLPKITFDQEDVCLAQTGVVNTATPGDSIEMEFWFTPLDTVVSDTIRGTFKVWYRGDIVPPGYVPTQPRDPAPSIRWNRSGLFAPRPLSGTVRMTDLRGRNCPLQARPSNGGTLLVPAHRPAPGVYLLSWPQGHATVLVPKE